MMSEHLIGFGCDLQQKLEAMKPKHSRTQWAGDVGIELYKIAQKLHRIDVKTRESKRTSTDNSKERQLMDQARKQTAKLGKGIEVHRQPDPIGWPLYIVFPGDVPQGSGYEAYYEQGIAVPPRP